MGKRALLTIPLLLLPACLPGQVAATDRTVAVTASRNSTVAPDLGVFTVQLYSPATASLDDVLAVLQGSGITAANFNSVNTTSLYNTIGRQNQDLLDWSFTLTAPLSNLKATVTQLGALQVAVARKDNGMSLTYSLRGTQTSPQAAAGQNCAAADLIADARTQAQKMAGAAGLSLGGVVAVSGSSLVTPAATAFTSGIYQPSCTLTVKFALTGM